MVYTVDHAAMTLAEGTSPEAYGGSGGPLGEGGDEESRVSLEAAIAEYVGDRFVDGTAASAVYCTKPGTLVAVISGCVEFSFFFSFLFFLALETHP